MKVMVTGSRTWTDKRAVLDALAAHVPADAHIIVGDCPTGADAIVRDHWPSEQTSVHFANWSLLGRAAGARRNQEMVDTKPDLVLAFPLNCDLTRCRGKRGHWTHGTYDAVRKAKAAKIKVKVILDNSAGWIG